MSKRPLSQRLLVLSDLHRGAAISAMPQYEAELRKTMATYDHVVLNGDIFELFYIDKRYYDENADGKKATTRIVRHAITSSINFLDDFLDHNPQTTLHFVLGNHENIKKFRHQLNRLQREHPNFEWSPEAIKLGDALFIHGDLPMSKATNAIRPKYELKHATKECGWADWLAAADVPGQAVVNYLRAPMRAIAKVHAWLEVHDGTETVFFRENRKKKPLEMDGIRHVFFGHTHVKFHNLEYGGRLYHNTGALTKTVMNHGGHGMLEAAIEAGKVGDVKPLQLTHERVRHAESSVKHRR